MGLKIFSHPDGGSYVIDNADVMGKMEDGSWEKGLVYRAVAEGKHGWSYIGRQFFWTSYTRWAERFTDTEIVTGGML